MSAARDLTKAANELEILNLVRLLRLLMTPSTSVVLLSSGFHLDLASSGSIAVVLWLAFLFLSLLISLASKSYLLVGVLLLLSRMTSSLILLMLLQGL